VTATTSTLPPNDLVVRYIRASFPQRLGALLVDGLLFLALVATPATLASWWFGPADFTNCEFVGSSESCSITPEALRFTRTVFYILTAVFIPLYARLISTGASIGKRSTECMVIDARTGLTIGYWRALARTVLSVIGVACFGLGLLFALANSQRLAVHDKIMGTRVISP
jgi:uncharacterized RDD family membrane protein YckC